MVQFPILVWNHLVSLVKTKKENIISEEPNIGNQVF